MIKNPIIYSDFPDPDVIRVEDTYYMISTTMHFMPGGIILQSYDLIHWEILTYVFDSLDNTLAQCLSEEKNIYGQGMWAACLRYHKSVFYVCFSAKDTNTTYLYQSDKIEGPWKKQKIAGYYHDCSLLFDEDRVFIVYGNTDIYITELNKEMTGPHPEGMNRLLVKDTGNVRLGYEGSHIYKVNDKYYLFLIHWQSEDSSRRTQACFAAKSLEDEFVGKDVFDEDFNFFNQGIAQGGIVDTPEGKWYAMLFQDRGALGRVPILIPIEWVNDFPVFKKIPDGNFSDEVTSSRPDHIYDSLTSNDDFYYEVTKNQEIKLKKQWQWNHTPDPKLWSVADKKGSLQIQSGKLSQNLELAINTITQRLSGPICESIVTVDGSKLKNGDFAGICALQGCYGFAGITKDNEKNFLVMSGKPLNPAEGIWGSPLVDRKTHIEYARIPIENDTITLKLKTNFTNTVDEAEFYYKKGKQWIKIGITQKLYFRLDHFTGCRVGLFLFSTKTVGGIVSFENFIIQ